MQHAFGRHIKHFHSNMPDFLEDTSIIYHHTPDYLEDTSNIFTPTSHNSFSSSIRACKYISISFSGEIRPGINNDSMKEDLFMHIYGGRLYEIKMIGHVL